jgi:hypothetical protein
MTCPTERSPVTEQERVVGAPIQLIMKERRSKLRYPLVLKVRYRALGRGLHSGVGQAVNLSSGDALVASQHDLGVAEELELSIEWPSHLDGGIPIQLVAMANVVRCGPCSFAVRFRRHQFRTLGSQVQPVTTSAFWTSARRRAIR